MEVKQVVFTAKGYVADLLQDEGVSNIGLEEVSFDDQADLWLITVGYTRREDNKMSNGPYKELSEKVSGIPQSKRIYRIIKVKEADGKVIGMVKPDYAD